MSNGPGWQKKEETRLHGTFFCGPSAGRGSLRTGVQQGNAVGEICPDTKKGLSPKRKPLNLLERETGFEPATSTLARLHSTTELLPRICTAYPPIVFLEATSRFELESGGFADLCLTTWLCRLICWSGRRDLNPRLQPWQGCTLPLSYSRSTKEGSTLETPFLSSSFFHFVEK